MAKGDIVGKVIRFRRVVKGGAIHPPKAAEMEARRLLTAFLDRLEHSPGNLDMETIRRWLTENDGVHGAVEIANALQEMLDRLETIIPASRIAAEWVSLVDRFARERLENRIANAMGVGMARIFDEPEVREAAELAAFQTAGLIVDVPREYIQNVARAALQSFQQIPFPEGRTLTQHLMHLNSMSYERAKVIARHQTSVINAAVNQTRQQAVGIARYYWSSSHDERTVGNPAGLYPKGNYRHGDHWRRDYRVAVDDKGEPLSYRWDKPFHDGAPGVAPGCRCVALPRIDTALLRTERLWLTDAA